MNKTNVSTAGQTPNVLSNLDLAVYAVPNGSKVQITDDRFVPEDQTLSGEALPFMHSVGSTEPAHWQRYRQGDEPWRRKSEEKFDPTAHEDAASEPTVLDQGKQHDMHPEVVISDLAESAKRLHRPLPMQTPEKGRRRLALWQKAGAVVVGALALLDAAAGAKLLERRGLQITEPPVAAAQASPFNYNKTKQPDAPSDTSNEGHHSQPSEVPASPQQAIEPVLVSSQPLGHEPINISLAVEKAPAKPEPQAPATTIPEATTTTTEQPPSTTTPPPETTTTVPDTTTSTTQPSGETTPTTLPAELTQP